MAKVFVDTNVLAYRLDGREPEKRRQARLRMAEPHAFILSTQVLLMPSWCSAQRRRLRGSS